MQNETTPENANYQKILNYFVEDYGDKTLIELEEAKHNIKNTDDLINYLNFAKDHNYYTGHYWNYLYNY